MNHSILKYLAMGILLVAGALSLSTGAAQHQDEATETSTSKAFASQRDAITSASFRVLRHVTQARNALHANAAVTGNNARFRGLACPDNHGYRAGSPAS